MQQDDLGDIVASGRATAEQWDAYWSAYAEDVERQRRENERNERGLAEKQAQQKPFEDQHTPEIYYPPEPVRTPPRDHARAAGAAGIGLGSATDRIRDTGRHWRNSSVFPRMPVSPLVVACLGERMVANHDIRHFRAFRFNELNSRLVLTGTEM